MGLRSIWRAWIERRRYQKLLRRQRKLDRSRFVRMLNAGGSIK